MPPKLLVLSPPRCGTQTIADALQVLGVKPVYHMREVGKSGHQEAWIRLMNAKSEVDERRVKSADLDALLHDWEAVADFPATLFPLELSKAYPTARVIIATRDEDAWYKSMMATLVHAQAYMPSPNKAADGTGQPTVSDTYHKYCWDNDFAANGRSFFRRYYETLDEAFSSEEALRFDVRSGWAPLCEYLGLPVPEAPWPARDDWRQYKVEQGLV